jgi:hypothetical protein
LQAAERLTRYVAEELGRPVPPATRVLRDAILERHGECVRAVLFYGSCLRRQTHEGVLDFYVLVDGYRSAYSSIYLAAINTLVPPNVFFLSRETEQGTLRCKYAVISARDFERGLSPSSLHPYLWARFCQPAALVYARDDESRRFAASCCAQAVLTGMRRLAVFLPARGRSQRFSSSALWQETFRRTYASELRTESEETVRSNYEADPDRYHTVAALALSQLQQDGWLEVVTQHGPAFAVEMRPMRRRLARLRWHLERPFCKTLALVRLMKNAATFGDWVPYILWKIERHTGTRPELSERQRKHPFLFGWPILARLLWRREIR